MSDLSLEPAATAKNVEPGQKALEEYAQRRQRDDRSLIAKLIVYSFVGMIGFVVAVFTVAVLFKAWNDMAEAAKFLMAVLSSVLLPVVTLVIGCYFGKEK
jgi:uncharacterized membrane protein